MKDLQTTWQERIARLRQLGTLVPAGPWTEDEGTLQSVDGTSIHEPCCCWADCKQATKDAQYLAALSPAAMAPILGALEALLEVQDAAQRVRDALVEGRAPTEELPALHGALATAQAVMQGAEGSL